MERTSKDPTAYLSSLPDGTRETMECLDDLIADVFAGHPRTVWEGVFWGGSEQTIIGYGDLTTTQSRGRVVEWFMVGLALQKRHYSLYVNAVDGKRYLAEAYADRLGKVKVGKSSIGFAALDDVDLTVLTELLERARNQLQERGSAA